MLQAKLRMCFCDYKFIVQAACDNDGTNNQMQLKYMSQSIAS